MIQIPETKADEATITIEHSCATVAGAHIARLPVHRVVHLTCGCTRYEAIRCDGTDVHHIEGAHCNKGGA